METADDEFIAAVQKFIAKAVKNKIAK